MKMHWCDNLLARASQLRNPKWLQDSVCPPLIFCFSVFWHFVFWVLTFATVLQLLFPRVFNLRKYIKIYRVFLTDRKRKRKLHPPHTLWFVVALWLTVSVSALKCWGQTETKVDASVVQFQIKIDVTCCSFWDRALFNICLYAVLIFFFPFKDISALPDVTTNCSSKKEWGQQTAYNTNLWPEELKASETWSISAASGRSILCRVVLKEQKSYCYWCSPKELTAVSLRILNNVIRHY